MNDKKTVKLGIQNWKVMNAYPPSDIIWSELQNIVNKDESWSVYTLPFLNYSLALSVLIIMQFLDMQAFKSFIPAKLIF